MNYFSSTNKINIKFYLFLFFCTDYTLVFAQELNKQNHILSITQFLAQSESKKTIETEAESTLNSTITSNNPIILAEVNIDKINTKIDDKIKSLNEELSLNTENKESVKLDENNSKNPKTEKEENNFLDKKENNKSLFPNILAVCAFISILGLLYFILIKTRKIGNKSSHKSEKSMEIISTLSLSPKRQLFIVKIRDKEIILANTESGLNFISEMNTLASSSAGQSNSHLTLPSQKRPFIEEPYQITEKSFSKAKEELPREPNATLNSQDKSEILMKILNKTKKKETNKEVDEKPIFSKLFANNFENESKRISKTREEEKDDESVENVTNLIREKLKNMKSTN